MCEYHCEHLIYIQMIQIKKTKQKTKHKNSSPIYFTSRIPTFHHHQSIPWAWWHIINLVDPLSSH